MNLAIDYGNTAAKVAIFEDRLLKQLATFDQLRDLQEFLSQTPAQHAIISSVGELTDQIVPWIKTSGECLVLHEELPLPIEVNYRTPTTLGSDRIAGVCGALEVASGKDTLVIDAGSCITYDFVDRAAVYQGGAISPGIQMRFKALHTFTRRLPLISGNDNAPLTGTTTEESIRSGVVNGLLGEVAGFVNDYRKFYPELVAVICGGDARFLESRLPGPFLVVPELVLIGLNRILQHNLHL